MNELIKYFNKTYGKNKRYLVKDIKFDRYITYEELQLFRSSGVLPKGEKRKPDDYTFYCVVKIDKDLPDTIYVNIKSKETIYNGILKKDENQDNIIIYKSGTSSIEDVIFYKGYLLFKRLIDVSLSISLDKKGIYLQKLDYPKSKTQIYKTYQIIKNYGINDDKLNELLTKVKLPKPKTIEEKELYTNCLYNKDDSEIIPCIEKIELLKDAIPTSCVSGNYGACWSVFDVDTSNIKNPIWVEIKMEYGENDLKEKGQYEGRLFRNEYEPYDFAFIDEYQDKTKVNTSWYINNISFSIPSSNDGCFRLRVEGNLTYIYKLTLTVYDLKNEGMIHSSQIYSLDARKLINKEKGLNDFAKKRDAILMGSVRLILDNDAYYDEDKVGYHSCSFGGDAIGDYSFTTGKGTAEGESSFATGLSSANSECQSTFGRYNIEDTENKYIIIVGNGERESHYSYKKSNAHTLDWEGNAWYKGNISIDGTPTSDKDLVPKKYVDEKIPQMSFNDNGELVITINGTTKTFVPKSE